MSLYKYLQFVLCLHQHFSVTPFTIFSFILIPSLDILLWQAPRSYFCFLLSLLYICGLSLFIDFFPLVINYSQAYLPKSSIAFHWSYDCLRFSLRPPSNILEKYTTWAYISEPQNARSKTRKTVCAPRSLESCSVRQTCKCMGTLSAVSLSCLGVLVIFQESREFSQRGLDLNAC